MIKSDRISNNHRDIENALMVIDGVVHCFVLPVCNGEVKILVVNDDERDICSEIEHELENVIPAGVFYALKVITDW